MALRFIGIDPGTDGNHCPTLWRDDETGDCVVKGWTVTDPATLTETAPDPNETVIRIPARMREFFTQDSA